MSKHGPEVWRQYNQRLEALLLRFVATLLPRVLFLIIVIIIIISSINFSFIYLFFFWGCAGHSGNNVALGWLHSEHCIVVYFTVFNMASWQSNSLIS